MNLPISCSSSSAAAAPPPASGASQGQSPKCVSLPGGSQVIPAGINGSLLDQVTMLAISMREAIAQADAGARSCQVR